MPSVSRAGEFSYVHVTTGLKQKQRPTAEPSAEEIATHLAAKAHRAAKEHLAAQFFERNEKKKERTAEQAAAEEAAEREEEEARQEQREQQEKWQVQQRFQQARRNDGKPPEGFGNAGAGAGAGAGSGRGVGATKPAWMVQKEKEEAAKKEKLAQLQGAISAGMGQLEQGKP